MQPCNCLLRLSLPPRVQKEPCFPQSYHMQTTPVPKAILCVSKCQERSKGRLAGGIPDSVLQQALHLLFFPNPGRQNFTKIKEVDHNLLLIAKCGWGSREIWTESNQKNSAAISRTKISSKAHFIKTNFNRKLFQGWRLALDPSHTDSCCGGTVCREEYFLVGSCVRTEMTVPSSAPLFFELVVNWDCSQISSTSLFPHNRFAYMLLRHLFNRLQTHPEKTNPITGHLWALFW